MPTPSSEKAKLSSRSSEKHNSQQSLKDVSSLVDTNLWDMGWSCLGQERRKPPAPGGQSDEGMAGTGWQAQDGGHRMTGYWALKTSSLLPPDA